MKTKKASGVILITCEYPPFAGGVATYAEGLIGAVRSNGIPATVIAPSYSDLPSPPAESDTHRVLGHHRIAPIAAWRILSILRRQPIDRILLAADIRSALLLYLLRAFHRRTYRVMVHGSEASKFSARSPFFRLARCAYLHADLVSYNSEATQAIFHEGIGRPSRETVSYLGVDPRWFEPADSHFEQADLARLPESSNVVCSVGRIEARKGQLETVRILARARDLYGLTDPIYVVAGKPEGDDYVASLQSEATCHGLTLIAPGRLSEPDLKRLYQRALCHSLFAQALPGKIEGFGLVLLEASAQGCPSVATRIGGIPETGALVDPDDLDAAARAIAAYAVQPALRVRQGENARERARSFSWASCAAKTFPEFSSFRVQF
jgi:phosphatidylinositol alpha-1,6-mannosyltransferase